MPLPPILANHAHVFPADINPKGTLDALLQHLDACNIAQAVCFAPFPHQLENPNHWLAKQLLASSSKDRLFAFGTINPKAPDIADQVARIADLGFRGIKFHHNGQDAPVLSPAARALYAAAEKHNLFLVFHAAVHRSRMRDTHIAHFDDIAWDYPKLRFSLEHVGGYHFFREALAVLFNHMPTPWDNSPSNLYAGLSSIFSTQRHPFWHLTDDQLRTIHSQLGARQMIFGLDFPYNTITETQLALTRLQNLHLPENDLALILGQNMRELLNGSR